jgi:hypothetical protein
VDANQAHFLTALATGNCVTFTTNTIAFNDTTPSETFASFLASNVPPVVGASYAGTLAPAGNVSDNGSLWAFSGTALFTSGTITHDDGITLYIDGGIASGTPFFTDAGPTNVVDSITGISGVHQFQLIYGECCGQPAILKSGVVISNPVPEPRQIGFVLFGLLAGAMFFRRRFAASEQQ